MSNLFIIGNGFDVAHDLPTRYANFKKYLSDNIKTFREVVEEDSEGCIKITEIPRLPERKIWYGKGVCAEYLQEEELIYWLVDEVSNSKSDMKWKEFELYLSELNIEAVLKKWGFTVENAMKIQESLVDISGFFFRWVNTIDLSKAHKKENMEKLIRKDENLVITFNYTETLEKKYGVQEQNICYIHGKRESDEEAQKRKDMVSIGADNSELIIGYDEKLLKLEDYNMKYKDEGVRQGILTATTGLIKKVEQNMFSQRAFFDRLERSEIQNIYSVGFSYSDVDMPYIQEICKRLEKSGEIENCVWHFEEYDLGERESEYRKKISGAGYTGKYSNFRMK